MKLFRRKQKNKQTRTPVSNDSSKLQYFRSSASSTYAKRRSSASNTSSRNEASKARNSTQYATRKRTKRNIKISSVISLFIFTGFIGIFLYASSVSNNESKVVVERNSFQFRPLDEYQSFVEDYISSNLLARSKLFFPVSDFNQQFTEQFPEVTSIDTKVPFADRVIEVTIATPQPLFQIAGSTNSGSVSYINASGSVLSSASQPSSKASDFPVMTVDSLAFTEAGSQLLTENEVMIMDLLEEEITEGMKDILPDGFRIKSADLDVSNGRLEVGFYSVNYIVRFSTYSDARNQVGALKAILQELYGDGAEERSLPQEYIDVRVYEKVFVK